MDAATPSKPDKYDEYAVKRACETIMEAEEIKQDPKMMSLVKEMMAKKHRAIRKVTSLKELRGVRESKSEDAKEGEVDEDTETD